MSKRTDELVRELKRVSPDSPVLRFYPSPKTCPKCGDDHPFDRPCVPALRSDYCPECQRIGCCGGEQDCAEYRRELRDSFARMTRSIIARINR